MLRIITLSALFTVSLAIPQQFDNLVGVRDGPLVNSHLEARACDRLSDGLSNFVSALLPHFKSAARRTSSSRVSHDVFDGSSSSEEAPAPFAPWTPAQLEVLERTPFHLSGLARKMTLAQRRLARPPGQSGALKARNEASFNCDVCVLLVDQIQDLWGATGTFVQLSLLVKEMIAILIMNAC